MIVSHGLGGSEEGLAGFATAMGAAGWRVIVMGHAESGRALLRQALTGGIARGEMRAGIRDAAGDPAHHRARMLDLDATFALATRGCRPPQLVLAGHSMGAMTTMFEAGATPRFGRLGANRFDAYVALSPQGVGHVFAEGAWRAVTRPVLMVTGTRDEGTDGDWRTRLSAFEGLPPGLKRLVVIPGATHMDVGGKEAREGATLAALTQEFLAGVRPASLAQAPCAVSISATSERRKVRYPGRSAARQVIIRDGAPAGPLEIFHLALLQGPEKAEQTCEAKQQRERHKIDEHIHAAASSSASGLAAVAC